MPQFLQINGKGNAITSRVKTDFGRNSSL